MVLPLAKLDNVTDHAVDNVARYVTAAVSQAYQNIDFPFSETGRAGRTASACMVGLVFTKHSLLLWFRF